MSNKYRYYVIRDQLEKWHALYARLRAARRYWLADRLRNAAAVAGVGIAGDVWYDAHELDKERRWIGYINPLVVAAKKPLFKAPTVHDYALEINKDQTDE